MKSYTSEWQLVNSFVPEFDPSISKEKPVDVLPKHTYLTKELQNYEMILLFFVRYVSGHATRLILSRAYTPKISYTGEGN